MIPVAYRKQQRGRVLHTVFPLLFLRRTEGGQGFGNRVRLSLGQTPACDVPAALLQIEIIQLFHFRACQGFNHRSGRVVNQQHHMGQFYGRVLPHLYPGRDS